MPARPWTDPLGNVWCATPDLRTIRAALVYHVKDDDWKLDASVALYLLPEHLFAGLGRTLPPVPTPKRVAKAVPMGIFEYAVKGNTLYDRMKGVSGLWEEWKVCTGLGEPLSRLHVAAAHEAFQHAGDVLPGEEAE